MLYRAIESKDRTVIQQIHDVISQSGLVTTDESDNTDSGHQCIPYIKNDVNDLFYQLEDLMVSVEKIKVKTATEVRGPPECYRMSRKRRGYCVIINNKKFYKHSYRRGSAADEQRLKQVFEQLGFELKTYHNLSANGITEKLKKLSKDQALSKDEALIVIILSHGTVDDVVVGSDDGEVTVQSLIEFFNVKNCLQLMDKPKIFFINACRGGICQLSLHILKYDKLMYYDKIYFAREKGPWHRLAVPGMSKLVWLWPGHVQPDPQVHLE